MARRVTCDVRRSDLVNKYIKRSIAIFVQRSFSIQSQIHWLQFNSIRLNSMKIRAFNVVL